MNPQSRTFQSTPGRAIAGFLLFVVLLSLPEQLIYARDVLRYWPAASWESLSDKFSLWFFPGVYPFYFEFAVLVCAPVWLTLHILGLRSRAVAGAAGFVLSAGAGAFLASDCPAGIAGCDPTPMVVVAAVSGIIGAFAALIAWRVAYRRMTGESA